MTGLSYAELRREAASGDVLLVSGSGLASLLVRIFTGESISHVAALVWIGGALWVAEMREFRGYVLTPASLWVADQLARPGQLWWGRAPEVVRAESEAVVMRALHYRGRRYGYLSLPRVWIQNLFGWRRGTRGIVCSTFAGRLWEAAGYRWRVTPTPGRFLEAVRRMERVTHAPETETEVY